MIDKALFKILCVCSAIIGAILGIAALFPFLTGYAILIVMFAIAPFMILYLKNLKIIKELEIEKSILMGAISGGAAFLGFSTGYFPLAFVLHLIFKIQSFLWVKVIFINIGFLIPMIILISLLCALINAFSGFLTAYLYTYFKQKNRG